MIKKIMEKKHYKKAVVVPMYNEKENIVSLYRALLNVGDDFVVILAICPSVDGTQELADSLNQQYDRLIVLHLLEKGLGKAYYEGFKKSLELGVDHIITMDGDFSHNPQDIPRLFEKGKEADLVIGSRYVGGGKTVKWDWKRRAMSRIACTLNRLILNIKVKDSTGGFRCYSQALIKYLLTRPLVIKGFGFPVEAVARAERGNWKIFEIPIIFLNRRRGFSKLKIRDIRSYLIEIFRLRKELKKGVG